MRLYNERYEMIKVLTVNVILKYNINCIPINGHELAIKMGIILVPYSSRTEKQKAIFLKESEDGFVIQINDKYYIFYNDEIIYERQNFTILHEIGHIVLGHTQDSELADAEANFFAKYILVPPILVYKLKLTTAEEIMEYFKVSYTVATNALEYYCKWYNASPYLTDYEINTIRIFDTLVACN